MYAPVLVTAAAAMPVTLPEAKAQCRVDHSDEDSLLDGLIAAATAHLDGRTGVLGRCIVTQTWRQDFDCWAKCMRLPLPASAISSVKYRNRAGQLGTVAEADYSLKKDDRGSFIRFNDDFEYPGDLAETSAILAEFTAGYGVAADVPAPIKAAILLLISHWYNNREAVGESMAELPMAVDALLAPYRRVGV